MVLIFYTLIKLLLQAHCLLRLSFARPRETNRSTLLGNFLFVIITFPTLKVKISCTIFFYNFILTVILYLYLREEASLRQFGNYHLVVCHVFGDTIIVKKYLSSTQLMFCQQTSQAKSTAL